MLTYIAIVLTAIFLLVTMLIYGIGANTLREQKRIAQEDRLGYQIMKIKQEIGFTVDGEDYEI